MVIQIKKVLLGFIISLSLFSLTGCQSTTYKDNASIIEVSAVKELMENDNIVLIDARKKADYDKGHVKGAVYLSPASLTISEPVIGLIATQNQIETALGNVGIKSTDEIIIYDNNNGVNASRIWWVLNVYGHEKVKVINGGEKAVLDGGLPLTLEVPEVQSTTYSSTLADLTKIATLDDVLQVIEGDVDGCILDVRSRAEYDEGAIPSAVLYPHTKNLYSDGTFKSSRDIYLDYNDLGLKKDELIIIYCKTSFRATQTAVLLTEAGYNNLKIYDGAWMEWSTKDMPKEEKVDTPEPSSQDAS